MSRAKPPLEQVQAQAAAAIANADPTPGAITPVETHGYSLAQVLPVRDPDPRVCATCTSWKASHMRRSVGQCMPGSGLHPLMTTDLQSCSDWSFKGD